MEEVIPLLPQDGGDGSPAAASHLFTADFRRVKYQILFKSVAGWVNKHERTKSCCYAAGERTCRRVQRRSCNISHPF